MNARLISTLTTIALCFTASISTAQDETNRVEIETQDALKADLFAGRLILDYASNADVILDEIPGRLGVRYEKDGKMITRTFAERVLLSTSETPEIMIESRNLRTSIIDVSASAGVSYLAFANIKGSNANYISYRVDRTATSKVSEDDIDWSKARSMVQLLKQSNKFPEDAEYFIVQVTSSICVHASLLRETDVKGKVAAFGLQANGDFFAQFSDERTKMLFEVTPAFIFPYDFEPTAKFMEDIKADLREHEKTYVESIQMAANIMGNNSLLTEEDLEALLLPFARELTAKALLSNPQIESSTEFFTPLDLNMSQD